MQNKLKSNKKLLLIGVDQAIPSLIEKFREEGRLPNINRLIEKGVYAQGLSCPPCDTPTNWATIATGTTTANHGATSFYMHVPGEPLGKGLKLRSRTQLAKFGQAEYFWEAADRQQKKSFVINYPAGWGSSLKHGMMSLFTWPIPQSEPINLASPIVYNFSTEAKKSEEKIRILDVKEVMDFPFQTSTTIKIIEMPKPKNIEIYLRKSKEGSYNELYYNHPLKGLEKLKINKWTPWITQKDIMYKEKDYNGIFRFRITSLDPEGNKVKIQRSAIYNTDGWTIPDSLGTEIIKKVPFLDHFYHKETEVEYMIEGGVTPFLKAARKEVKSLSKVIKFTKNKYDWDICFFHIHHLDSVNHKMLARMESKFPKYKKRKAKEAEQNVRIAYQIVDEMVGDLLDSVVDDETIVCFLADHGAIPAWKIANIPKALMDAGLLKYQKNPTSNQYKIDWKKSKIFPYLEPPYIWVNLEGREPHGCVKQENYEDIRQKVINVLKDMRDPETNDPIVRKAARKEDLEKYGQNGERVGDIVYFLNPPYEIFDGRLADLNAEEISSRYKKKNYSFKARKCYGAHVYYLPETEFLDYSISVPIILMGPGIKKGIKLQKKCQLIDIAPTLARLIGIKPPKNSIGKVQPAFFE